MNLLDVITKLYAAEINCGFQTDWDGGFYVWLGRRFENDGDSSRYFLIGEWDKAAEWLDRAATAQTAESPPSAPASLSRPETE